MDELKVFTGNTHPTLAQAVTDYLGIPLGNCEVFEFSEEEIGIVMGSAAEKLYKIGM